MKFPTHWWGIATTAGAQNSQTSFLLFICSPIQFSHVSKEEKDSNTDKHFSSFTVSLDKKKQTKRKTKVLEMSVKKINGDKVTHIP